MSAWCEGPQVTLRAHGYEAVFAPSAGGRLASLHWQGGGTAHALVVPWDGRPFDPHDWPKAGAFAMLPFANRLPPQGFDFRGRRVQPHPGPQGAPLHGLAHRAAWTVIDATADTLTLRWVHPADEEWPWAFVAEQAWQLGPQGLSLRLEVRNAERVPMPLVMGWHPYHPTGDDLPARGGRLRAQAQHALDAWGRAGDPAPLPTGAPVMPPGGATVAFSGWDGAFRLAWGAAGALVTHSGGASCLVLHAAPDGRYLCAEPVTRLPGHLAMAHEPACLAPGETGRLTWLCAWEAEGAAP